ncbi:MAG: GTPase domain-containing protein, partial [Candidatus Odinarchaeota archaeon]|nr:GTPase domain-containing protein [Candidatus Odinarchaeota archaeon]
LYDTSKNPDKYKLVGINLTESHFFELNEMIKNIRNGIPPSKTLPEKIHKLGVTIKVNQKEVNLSIIDTSGEYLKNFGQMNFSREEVLKNPENRRFLNRLKYCDVFLIFFDPTKKESDLLLQSRGLNNIMIILREKLKRTTLSTLVIIPKCDLFPEIFRDPDGWLMGVDRLLYPYLKKNFKNFRVFAISAYGEAKQFSKGHWIPKERDFTPKGIVEVFKWIRKMIV